MKSQKLLVALAIKYNGDFQKILSAIENKETITQEYELPNGIKAITILDVEYPFWLRNTFQPPFVLFYKGDISLLKEKSIAIVGSKEVKEKDIHVVFSLTHKTDNVVITKNSGGINETVIDLAQKCIIVFNGEIDGEPKENQLFVSEFFKTEQTRVSCLRTNCLVAGLCDKVVIINGKKYSNLGTIVSLSLSYGHDIYAIPGEFNEDCLTNYLIRNGAIPLLNVEDLK